jgi:hypothetical protein
MERLKEVEQSLPFGDCWLISLGDPLRCSIGGRLTQVHRGEAARLIVDGRFRLATDQEAAEHEAEVRAASERERFERICPRVLYFGKIVTLPPAKKSAKAAR